MRTVGTSRTVLACVECGTTHAKWSGQCAGCGAWNSIVEETVAAADAGDPGRSLRPLAPVSSSRRRRRFARRAAADRRRRARPGARRWAGPRVGHAARRRAGHRQEHAGDAARRRVAGADAVRQRRGEPAAGEGPRPAPRPPPSTTCGSPSETSVRGVVAAIDEVAPELVLVDSIQTIADERVASSPGSATQVRECAQQLVVEAKRRNVAVLLVGHVTKEGAARRAAPARAPRRHGAVASRATATTPCASCGRASTASAASTRSGCSR